jgi:hypothetical protein
MNRRGFFGAMAAAWAAKRLPFGDTPIVEAPLSATFVPTSTVAVTGCLNAQPIIALTDVNGVASFTNLAINRTGTHMLHFTSSGAS